MTEALTGAMGRLLPPLAASSATGRRLWPRRWRSALIWDAGLVLGSLYLCFTLLASPWLRDALWYQGGHGTPEDWAQHAVLSRIGSGDHHRPARPSVLTEAAALTEGSSFSLIAAPGTQVRSAIEPVFPFTGDTLMAAILLASLVLAPAVVIRRPADDERPLAISLDPPEKPPLSSR